VRGGTLAVGLRLEVPRPNAALVWAWLGRRRCYNMLSLSSYDTSKEHLDSRQRQSHWDERAGVDPHLQEPRTEPLGVLWTHRFSYSVDDTSCAKVDGLMARSSLNKYKLCLNLKRAALHKGYKSHPGFQTGAPVHQQRANQFGRARE
jgi:hypothetical protein